MSSNQQFHVTQEEATRAKWPHEIFLINLVFNHIFIFIVSMLMVKSFPMAPALVVVISVSIILYIVIKSKQVAKGDDSIFVKLNWEVCAKRNTWFVMLLTVTLSIIFGGLQLSQAMHWSKINTMALIGGVGLLPFMVVLLLLVVLGNDSVHLARSGRMAKGMAEKAKSLGLEPIEQTE
jgi:hypothetical protein